MDYSLKNRFVHRTLSQPICSEDLINQTYTVMAKVAAQVIDMSEDAIVQAVMNAAQEEGVTDLYLMDRRFVIEALIEKANRERNVGVLEDGNE